MTKAVLRGKANIVICQQDTHWDRSEAQYDRSWVCPFHLRPPTESEEATWKVKRPISILAKRFALPAPEEPVEIEQLSDLLSSLSIHTKQIQFSKIEHELRESASRSASNIVWKKSGECQNMAYLCPKHDENLPDESWRSDL